MASAAREALADVEAGTTPDVVLFQSHLPISDIRRALGEVSEPGSLQVLTRGEWLAQAELDITLSEPVLLTATGLGAACFVGLAVREGYALTQRRRRDLVTLVAIGADRRRIVFALGLIEGIAIVVACLIAAVVVENLAYRHVLASHLPPSFRPVLYAGLASGAGAYLITLALATWRRLERFDAHQILTHP